MFTLEQLQKERDLLTPYQVDLELKSSHLAGWLYPDAYLLGTSNTYFTKLSLGSRQIAFKVIGDPPVKAFRLNQVKARVYDLETGKHKIVTLPDKSVIAVICDLETIRETCLDSIKHFNWRGLKSHLDAKFNLIPESDAIEQYNKELLKM